MAASSLGPGMLHRNVSFTEVIFGRLRLRSSLTTVYIMQLRMAAQGVL